MEALRCTEKSGNTDPATQRHISEELNPQHHRCGISHLAAPVTAMRLLTVSVKGLKTAHALTVCVFPHDDPLTAHWWLLL